jgi:hypothetical protein
MSKRRRPPRFKPPALRTKVRRREPVAPLPESVLLLLLGLLMGLTLLSLHAATAGAATRIAAPRTVSPGDGAPVAAVPSFHWKGVSRAAQYEFQLSADPAFKSIVLGQQNGSFFTRNTFASVNQALADGSYYWRVRAIDAGSHAGRWSSTRSIAKRWTAAPVLLRPADGGAVTYPATPLILSWAPVPGAYKYLLRISTDPGLANSALGDMTPTVETSGTDFALPGALAPGRYFWAVTPLDNRKHPGTRSAVFSFDWSWPTTTTTRVSDLDPDADSRNPADRYVLDPQFSWDPVPGAAQYQVEVNFAEDFAIGSRVCCDESVVGTTHSPLRLMPLNTYFWRVRAIDVDGNAGVWNTGPAFKQGFYPPIRDLRIRDNLADAAPAIGASGLPTTDAPVVSWSPVHGASSYEVRVAPWAGFCNWTATSPDKPTARTAITATTSWTPLGPFPFSSPVGNAFPTPANDFNWALIDNTSYCVRVRARRDRDATFKEITSGWTYLGQPGAPAFTFKQTAPATCPAAPLSTPASAYHEPVTGRVSARMPLFTWTGVPGACGYFVVVARDREFTKIVDVALTTEPAYAPRTGLAVTTYADETSTYYWAVLPTTKRNGDGLSTDPTDNHPQAFEKRSVPPALRSPAPGADVPTQPVFRWTAVEGARQYRIQIDDDPTFGSPIADVPTNATSYTSTSALPADSVLYWRVRANDENLVGLNWSPTRTFRRRLPAPVVAAHPPGGEGIPILSWTGVLGAVSYDMHVEQVDGTKRDFTMRSTAFTPVIFYGTGVWQWQVRANFRAGVRVVSGGYFPAQPFTRRIATPSGGRTTRSGTAALLSWDPAQMAKSYRVQIATTDSFSQVIEQTTTDNTSWAPRMTAPGFAGAQRLYWRVAVVDEGNNLGGWATLPMRSARRASMRVKGKLHRGRSGIVRVTVTGGGRRLGGAVVHVRGAGLVIPPRRTNRRGQVRLRLTPRSRGTVRFSADKSGFAPATGKLRVR